MAATHAAVDAARRDYERRRLAAADHGEKLRPDEVHAVPVERELPLTGARAVALSRDELYVAVAHGDALTMVEVAALLQAVRRAAMRIAGFVPTHSQVPIWLHAGPTGAVPHIPERRGARRCVEPELRDLCDRCAHNRRRRGGVLRGWSEARDCG